MLLERFERKCSFFLGYSGEKLKPKSLFIFLSHRNLNRYAKIRRKERRKQLSRFENLYDEKIANQMSDIKSADKQPYEAMDYSILPTPEYKSQNNNIDQVPFVKPLNEPYPSYPFNEVRPEPLLVWNEFQERYELRDKRILSEKTKKIILSMNRRYPTKWTKDSLSKTLGLSTNTIDFIFWEDEMRKKYKIPYDLDSIKLLEAYCGTDILIESKLYSMMAYSEVTGDPYYTSGKYLNASPLILPQEELDETLYSWQKKQQYKPRLSLDQYEIIPQDGTGSGKKIDYESNNMYYKHSYMVVDIDDSEVNKLFGRPVNVKVREVNGTMRWSTLDEVNWVREREYPQGYTPHQRIRRVNVPKLKREFPRRPYINNRYVGHYYYNS